MLEVYGLSVASALLVWPQDAPRLWIPAVPILLGYAILGAQALARARLVQFGIGLYLLVFAMAGALVLGNSMRLSLSGSKFPDHWARDTPLLHATYQVAFGRATPEAAGPVHRDALRVLRYYEPRASTPRARREAE